MNNGNNNNIDTGDGNCNPQCSSSSSGQSSRSRNNRSARSSGRSPQNQDIPVENIEQMDEQASTALVNSIKQGALAVNRNCVSPIENPVGDYNGSPVHQQQGNAAAALPECAGAGATWQVDYTNWGPRNNYDQAPYPKCIPQLNGSPYEGGPTTSSPSPVGSSRSTYSTPSPPQVASGGSSPRMSNYFPTDRQGSRRCSAEEMACKAGSSSDEMMIVNLHEIAQASSSQSPVAQYNFNPIIRSVESRLSDEVNYVYYPTSRSSESRSSNDSSMENTTGDSGAGSPVSATGSQGNTNVLTRCTDCTPERLCNRCYEIYNNNALANVADNAGLAQGTPPRTELAPGVTSLEIVPYNHYQNRPINQPSLPPANQLVLANRQLNITQVNIPNNFPISGEQLAICGPPADKPLASSSPLMFMNQRVISEQPILYCAVHNGAQRFYCETCSKLFCNECGPKHHVGHVTVHLLDATENAQRQAEEVISECRFSIATIRGDIDRGVIAAQTLDAKAGQAIATVRDLFRKMTEALRSRERELIESIEATRQNKQSSLRMRDEALNFGLARLSQTLDKLSRSVEASSLASNPLDLFIAKDMASAQIFHVRTARNNLPPPEEHYIRFQLMDNHIINSIRNLGKVLTGNGHIGDRRLLARRIIPSLAPSMPVPRGRAIPALNFPVSIISNRPYNSIEVSTMSLGRNFSAEDNICRPWGVACDREGHILIADRSNNRIQIFRLDGSFVRRFGSHGSGCGQFDRPAGIAVDARRRIVVADKDNHRIQVFTMDGDFLLSFGEKGTTPGLFTYPWDVATNDACQIVVSDTRNHRIQMFSPEGIFLRKFGFGTNSPLLKRLDSPRGVAFNSEGNIIVTDFNNHRIVVVDYDFAAAKFLGCNSLAPHPMPPKTLMRPQGVAIDDHGHIIVCDSRNHRVQIFDSNGVHRRTFGSQGSAPDEMDRPAGVAVTPDGRIVVVDFGNNRVLVF